MVCINDMTVAVVSKGISRTNADDCSGVPFKRQSMSKKVHVGSDQENAQYERNSNSKNRGGKNQK